VWGVGEAVAYDPTDLEHALEVGLQALGSAPIKAD
jgi:hypothetical protein